MSYQINEENNESDPEDGGMFSGKLKKKKPKQKTKRDISYDEIEKSMNDTNNNFDSYNEPKAPGMPTSK